MTYEYFSTKIGQRFSIVEGIIVEDTTGPFVVSENFGDYVIYLNKINRSWNIIAPKKSYLARQYILRKSDCISLTVEWLKDTHGSKITFDYNKLSNRDFYRIYKEGLKHCFEENGFVEVTTPRYGDCLVYDFKQHSGVYLDNKILHHLPRTYSSIDTVDNARILGIYRNDSLSILS
jgi:hypothetical protein